MRVYADAIEPIGSIEQFMQLAEYFYSHGQLIMAGKFTGLAKNYPMVYNWQSDSLHSLIDTLGS